MKLVMNNHSKIFGRKEYEKLLEYLENSLCGIPNKFSFQNHLFLRKSKNHVISKSIRRHILNYCWIITKSMLSNYTDDVPRFKRIFHRRRF